MVEIQPASRQILDGDTLIRRGYFAIALSATFLAIIGMYGMGFGRVIPLSGIPVLDALVNDTHYKYLIIMLIPTSTYFVIANWVGWQYYQNS